MELLPTKNQILSACRGDTPGDHPLLQWAAELALAHEQLLNPNGAARESIDNRRVELIHNIDRWVARELIQPLGCARLHTETLGAVIDRLAMFTVHANAALTGTHEWELWDSWERLAELAVGYDDLKDEISTGRRRLPVAPPEATGRA
ncbi:DUF4254 domain-containing protein [Nocardia sp. CDC160]|uniref:DUF4254 domain-containing protein n=1 Tax=Nocardia sp. CDC160 TaxID=3112166 RepID=UPI002DC00C93|nr:DUF4254 domain-containing protein [Nocardia sp. CDC160]MEC3919309.1 DUF4254 domain-containing protein [Nocardia sp. CDC160]